MTWYSRLAANAVTVNSESLKQEIQAENRMLADRISVEGMLAERISVEGMLVMTDS
jgi:hypothetical protein